MALSVTEVDKVSVNIDLYESDAVRCLAISINLQYPQRARCIRIAAKPLTAAQRSVLPSAKLESTKRKETGITCLFLLHQGGKLTISMFRRLHLRTRRSGWRLEAEKEPIRRVKKP